MTDDPLVPFAFDCTLRRPGCVNVQAGLGGTSTVCHLFETDLWVLYPSPDMRVYNMPLSHWRRVADQLETERR